MQTRWFSEKTGVVVRGEQKWLTGEESATKLDDELTSGKAEIAIKKT